MSISRHSSASRRPVPITVTTSLSQRQQSCARAGGWLLYYCPARVLQAGRRCKLSPQEQLRPVQQHDPPVWGSNTIASCSAVSKQVRCNASQCGPSLFVGVMEGALAVVTARPLYWVASLVSPWGASVAFRSGSSALDANGRVRTLQNIAYGVRLTNPEDRLDWHELSHHKGVNSRWMRQSDIWQERTSPLLESHFQNYASSRDGVSRLPTPEKFNRGASGRNSDQHHFKFDDN